jgi:hypothetical protein
MLEAKRNIGFLSGEVTFARKQDRAANAFGPRIQERSSDYGARIAAPTPGWRRPYATNLDGF